MQDHKEHQQANVALNESEARFQLLFEGANDAIFLADAETGLLIDCNLAAQTLLGRERDEIVGQPQSFLHPPDETQRYRELFRQHTTSDVRTPIEAEVLRKDGQRVPVSIAPSVTTIGSQKVIQGIFRDMTERKRVEQSLQMMRLSVDHAGDSIFWVNREGRILYANIAACFDRGYSQEEMLGLTVFDLDVEPHYRPGLWEQHFEELKRSGTITLESRHRTKDGRVFPIEVNANYVHIGGQEINFAFVRDISERKQAEERLKATEQRLATVFNSSPVGICITTIEEGKLLELNDVCCEIGRCRREDVIGRNAVDLGYWPTLDDREKLIHKIKQQGSIRSDEFAFRRKDGTIGHALRSIERLTFDGQDCILSMFIDITERKQIEEELQTSRQRLESLSRQLITTQETERRHLARELHDQIGQVLTAIKMNLRRTQRSADVAVQSALEENVVMVDQAILDVRNLSRGLRPPQLDELGLVAALHWLLKHQAQLAEFQDHLDIDLGGVQIPSDVELVCFRIAQEAVTNAVRHGMPAYVSVQLQAKNNDIVLSIHDDGIGFEVGGSQLRALKGDSIGLISMQERARLVGGDLEIESTPGRGTTIRVRIPFLRDE